jgi:hypothetical protein
MAGKQKNLMKVRSLTRIHGAYFAFDDFDFFSYKIKSANEMSEQSLCKSKKAVSERTALVARSMSFLMPPFFFAAGCVFFHFSMLCIVVANAINHSNKRHKTKKQYLH